VRLTLFPKVSDRLPVPPEVEGLEGLEQPKTAKDNAATIQRLIDFFKNMKTSLFKPIVTALNKPVFP